MDNLERLRPGFLPALGLLAEAIHVSFRGLQLTVLPEEISLLSRLQGLYADENKLFGLPDSFSQLSDISALDVSYNCFSQVPDAVSFMTQLCILKMNQNHISEIPQWITLLTNLTKLEVKSKNDHKELRVPKDISILPCWASFQTTHRLYTVVTTEDTAIYQMNRKIIDMDAMCPMFLRFQHIDVSNNTIYTVPDSVTLMTDLLSFVINKNLLCNFPTPLISCRLLTRLSFSSNKVSILPEQISRMNNLVRLDMNSNELKFMPEGISQLTSLEILRADYNKISDFPDLRNLKRLQIVRFRGSLLQSSAQLILHELKQHSDAVFLRGRNLSEISEVLIRVPYVLRKLDLSFNQISYLPPWIGVISQLEELDISHNQISVLPVSLGNLKKLSKFNFSENPITDAYIMSMASDTKSVLNLLQERTGGTHKWNQVRLVIVGEQIAGKTTLTKSLLSQGKFQSNCDPRRIATVGADISPHPMVIQTEGTSLEYIMWDFGGQEEFQITHPFFLSSGSLVLLAWDTSLGPRRSKIIDWACMIAAMTPGVRVIVVGTKIDLESGKLDQQRDFQLQELKDLLAPYQSSLKIIDYLFVSNHTGEGIELLKNTIARCSWQLPSVHQELPASYIRVKEAIEAIGKARPIPVATFNEIEELCASISQSIDAFVVLQFLQDLGVIVWNKSDNLNKVVICHPPFLIRIFLQVFNFIRSNFDIGAYAIRDLENMFEVHFPSMAEYVLHVFRGFRLSFPIRDGTVEVFPSLLPRGNPPMHVWSARPAQGTVFFASEVQLSFLPRAFFGHLISVLNLYSKPWGSSVDVPYLSRNIFVADFHYPEENASFRACIEKNPGERILYVSVRSADSPEKTFKSLRFLVNIVNKAVVYFKGITISAQNMFCPRCVQCESRLQFCGKETFPDNITDYKDIHISCIVNHDESKPSVRENDSKHVEDAELSDSGRLDDIQISDLTSVPSTFQLAIEKKDGEQPRLTLRLMCDNPATPHTVSSLVGYYIHPELLQNRRFLVEFLRVLHFKSSDINFLSDMKGEDLSGHLYKWIERFGLNTHHFTNDVSFMYILSKIDPGGRWQTHLQLREFPNTQTRYLCDQCCSSMHGTQRRPIQEYSLSATVWYRKEKIMNAWRQRYFVFIPSSRRLIRYMESTSWESRERIIIPPKLQVLDFPSNDEMFGIKFFAGGFTHLMKTQGEKDLWLKHLQA